MVLSYVVVIICDFSKHSFPRGWPFTLASSLKAFPFGSSPSFIFVESHLALLCGSVPGISTWTHWFMCPLSPTAV